MVYIDIQEVMRAGKVKMRFVDDTQENAVHCADLEYCVGTPDGRGKKC